MAPSLLKCIRRLKKKSFKNVDLPLWCRWKCIILCRNNAYERGNVISSSMMCKGDFWKYRLRWEIRLFLLGLRNQALFEFGAQFLHPWLLYTLIQIEGFFWISHTCILASILDSKSRFEKTRSVGHHYQTWRPWLGNKTKFFHENSRVPKSRSDVHRG